MLKELRYRREHGESEIIFEKYLEITKQVAEGIGVENLHSLIKEVNRFSQIIPESHKFGKTYEGSRFSTIELRDLDCFIINCATPESESVSGLGSLWPDEKGELSLKLPRHVTGPGARENLEFLGYQMSWTMQNLLGMPDPETSAIIDFYREGPWTEVQRHLWSISKGRVEIPTDKLLVAHGSEKNFLGRVAILVNGEKLFYQNDVSRIETLFLSDSIASGAQVAKVLDYLINERGLRLKRVVLMAPMATLFSAICIAELLKNTGIELIVCTGASILDIHYGNEPFPGSLYYSPYPTSLKQLVNGEFRSIYDEFHPETESQEGIRGNWTESFLLTIRAMIDSEAELNFRGTSNKEIGEAMARITKELLIERGLDWRKVYSYAARLQSGW